MPDDTNTITDDYAHMWTLLRRIYELGFGNTDLTALDPDLFNAIFEIFRDDESDTSDAES